MASLEQLTGCLLGTAVGDAWGLPAEGLAPRRAQRVADASGYRFLGRRGWISDDTEHTVLLAEALCAPDPARHFRAAFRRWFWRLPFGLGGATLRAGLRATLGRRVTGVASAGNGAMMRAPILGLLVPEPVARRQLGTALAQVTHTDARAIEAARFAAELTAHAALPPAEAVAAASLALEAPALREALAASQALARSTLSAAEASARLGTTGFVVHSVGLCAFALLRSPARGVAGTLRDVIAAGGDADTHAALVGGWLGAHHGPHALPASRVAALPGGPFGAQHLRELARALFEGAPPPRWSAAHALARNLAAWPVMLTHGFARLAGHPWR